MSRGAYEPKTGRSKFTKERQTKILEGFALGAAPSTVAALAKISVETLYRWLKKGEEAPEESQWHKFYLDVQEARALPRERALRIVHDAMTDYPQLAWKYIERTEPGYAPPTIGAPQPNSPVVIQLSFSDGAPLPIESGEIVDGEVIDVESARPAALPAP